jgi:hypothetical protein
MTLLAFGLIDGDFSAPAALKLPKPKEPKAMLPMP